MTYQDIVNIIRNAANYVNPDGFFIHGRKTDGSLQYNESFPQIILLEPTPNTSINNNSFVETISFPIIFVAQDTPETTELRREDLKQEMYLLSRKLLSKIDENELLQNVSYAGGQPEIRQMSGTATGFSYTLEITYPLSECTLDFDLPPTIQLFATQTTVNSGTEIQIGWIANNVNSVVITPFGTLQGQFGFVTTTINATTTFTGTATNSAGTATDTITITVSNGCDDATAVLKNTDGTILSTTDIPSGDTQDIIAPDANVQSSGGAYNVDVPSGDNLVIPDTTAILKNTSGTTLSTNNIESTTSEDIIAPDGDVTVNGVAFTSVESGGTENIEVRKSTGNDLIGSKQGQYWRIPNNDVEINGVNEGSVPATETVEIDLEDSGGNPVTPTSVTQTGNTFTVELPSSALAVDFSVDDTTPDTNQTVTFTDLTVGATDWLWDFGDGNCSALQNPTHAYKYAGSYTVTLFASDGSASGLAVKTNYITVTLQVILATDLQASYIGSDYDATTGTWTDITGGFNLTQANAANRPAKLTAAINGLDAVQSDANDFLINTSALFDRSSAEQTMAFVIRHDVGSTAQRVLTASNITFPIIYTFGGTMDYRIDNPTNRPVYAGPNITFWAVVIFGFSNVGNGYVLINDQLVSVANTGAGGANTGLSLFGTITGTLSVQCSIAELRIYNTLKTGADLTNIANYLKSKYALW